MRGSSREYSGFRRSWPCWVAKRVSGRWLRIRNHISLEVAGLRRFQGVRGWEYFGNISQTGPMRDFSKLLKISSLETGEWMEPGGSRGLQNDLETLQFNNKARLHRDWSCGVAGLMSFLYLNLAVSHRGKSEITYRAGGQ